MKESKVSVNVVKSHGHWPDFIGIGTIKSGTTWIHQCIAEHPQVFTPHVKEIHYFNARYDMGEDWYKSFFSVGESHVSGEWTPAYVHDPDSLERMRCLPPTTKFIVSVRNPIDRAYSDYIMRLGGIPGSGRLCGEQAAYDFDRVVREVDHRCVRFGFYAKQLRPYLQVFGRTHFHLVNYEDILQDPCSAMRAIYRFLDINSAFVPPSVFHRLNEARRYRYTKLFNALRRVSRAAEHIGFRNAILRLKTNGFQSLVLSKFAQKRPYIPMLPETREYLRKLYYEDSQLLASMFDTELHWDV